MRRAEERAPEISRALLISGLLVFGTVFAGAVMVLNSSTIFPGSYDRGAFVFTSGFLYGGAGNELVVVTADRFNQPLAEQEVLVTLTNSSGSFELLRARTDEQGILDTTFIVPEQPGAEGEREKGDRSVLLTVVAGRERVERRLQVYNQPPYSGAFSPDPGAAPASKSDEQPSVSERVPPRIYLTMDKPRYQPGQVMHLRTLSFWPGAANTENVTYVVEDPSGNKLFRATLTPNKFGVTYMDYPLSDILPLGTYKLTASTASALAVKSVPVERYVVPKFGIDFVNISSSYTLDDIIKGELSVSYFFGKPVQGTARVTARLYSEDDWYWYCDALPSVDRVIANQTLALAGGRGGLTIPPARSFVTPTGYSWIDKYRQFSLDIRAEVTDTGGHTEAKNTTLTISPEAFYATLVLETATPGQPLTASVVVRSPLGQPVAGAHIAPSLKRGDKTVELPQVTTDSRGVAEVSFTYNKEELLEVRVWTGDPGDAEVSSYYFCDISAVKLAPDKRFYNVGDRARVTVYADPGDDNAGVAGLVMVDVLVGGEPAARRTLRLEDGKATYSFDVTEDMVPALELEARKLSVLSYERFYYGLCEDYYYYRGQPAPESDELDGKYTMAMDRTSVGVGISSQLNVSVSPSPERLEPGEDVELTLRVLDGDEPVSAALAIAIVDEALLSMGGDSAFAEIRRDLQRDPGFEQYSIYSYIWGGGGALREAVPLFRSAYYSDYRPDAGLLSYSSEVISLETHAPGSPAVSGGVTLGLFALGVMGYFSILWIGIRRRMMVVALVAALILLAGAAPLAVWLAPRPGLPAFSDTGQPLSFTEETRAGSYGYYGYEGIHDGGVERNLAPAPGAVFFGGAGEGNASQAGAFQPRGVLGPGRQVTLRTWFPELWYWNPLVLTAEDGTACVVLSAPDSITTWRVEALGSTVNGRVGVGGSSLVVFLPFFVDPDLPVSVVRNDRFTFRVMIYNYEPTEREVEVELSPSDWYQMVSSPRATAVVAPESVSSVAFTIRALRVGVHDLRVTGTTDTRQDIIVRQLAVEPDGRLVEDIRNGILENDSSAHLSFELDARRVPGSELAYIKLQAGVESVIVDGAEGFIEVVSGCGEQSTSRLSVDILAYENYIMGQPDPANVTRYRSIISMGVQHEAQYLSSNTGGHGRAIVWHTGEAPDIWLTAWAIQAYRDLQDNGFLADGTIIPDLQTYLLSAQKADGHWEFPDVGHWSINSALKSQSLAATAYIARALARSGLETAHRALDMAGAYIEANIGAAVEPFTVALCLDALETLGGDPSARASLVQRLASAAKDGGSGAKYWEYADRSPDLCWRSDNTIETTGYAIMALARAGSSPELVRAGAKYLVLQRGWGGYWGSTHNTAVAFTALNGLDEIAPLRSMEVEVRAEGELVGSVSFNDSTKDLTRLLDLRPWFASSEGGVSASAVSISLRSTGEGGVFYHVYTRQSIEWSAPQPPAPAGLRLVVNYSKTSVSVGDVIVAEAEVTYTGPADIVRMVLVELRAPAGFALDETDFRDMLADGTVSFYELRGQDRALVYLDGVRRDRSVELEYTLAAMRPAASLLQHVRAWDMYNTTLAVEAAPVALGAA
ncbi:MAG: alpha-2-macroglobulin family protein [Thermoplasmatota archaeon]